MKGRYRVCSEPGCGILTTGTRCIAHASAHEQADNARRHEKAKALGLHSRHWKQVRRARLAFDGYRCALRRPGCTGEATSVHLDPSLRGNHALATIDNTRSACAHCHGVVDAPRARRAA